MSGHRPDSSLPVGHLTVAFKTGLIRARQVVILNGKPNGMNRAITSVSNANRVAMPIKAGDAAVAAERSAKGSYVDRKSCP
jgi:hypothetical protein